MAKQTPIGFGRKQKSRERTVVCQCKKDESRPGFVVLKIWGLTESEAIGLMPGLTWEK